MKQPHHIINATIIRSLVIQYRTILIILIGSISATSAVRAQNLVLNGGFETGSFSSWTLTGNTGSTSVGGEFAHTGLFGTKLGPVGSDGVLTQSLATTPGASYDLSFWLQNTNGNPNDFTVSFGGVTVFNLLNSPGFSYTQYTFTDLAATGGSTLMQFSYRQDPGSWNLDDVSVTASATPEPSTGLLLTMGAVGLFLRRKRHARNA